MAFASVIISLTSVVTYILVRRTVQFNLLGQIVSPLIASLVLIGGTMFAKPFFPQTIIGLIETGILAALLYSGTLFILDSKKLKIQIITFLSYAKA